MFKKKLGYFVNISITKCFGSKKNNRTDRMCKVANRKYSILVAVLFIGIALIFVDKLYLFKKSSLPSWLSFSPKDVSSVSVQGWGPGKYSNFTVHPAVGQSSILINSLVKQLPQDKAIKPYVTTVSTGGESWLNIQLENGSLIDFKSFPNEPKPFQYHVILTSSSGKEEKNAMISDISGVVTNAINEIKSKGVMVSRTKSH